MWFDFHRAAQCVVLCTAVCRFYCLTLSCDQKTMKNQLRIVEDKIYKKKAGVTNSLKPYEGILPDAPSDSFKQKKGKGSFKSILEDQPKKKKRTK